MSSSDSRPPFAVPLPKKGTNADALFSLPASLAVGSPYVDPHKLARRAKPAKSDDRPLFKPAGFVHFTEAFPTLAVSDSAAASESGPLPVGKKQAVVVRGVYVNRANEAFWAFPEHISDPAEEKIKQRRAELHKLHEQLKDLPPFRVSAPALAPFSKAKELYYSLVPRGGVLKPRKIVKAGEAAAVAAFRPAGTCPAFSKVSEYLSDPAETKPKKEASSAPQVAWRPSDAAVKAKPAPSVAFNILNLRKEPGFPLR